MYKVIFLDIDGVLIAEEDSATHRMADFSLRCIASLREVLTKTEADIVITSNWRRFRPISLGYLWCKHGLPIKRIAGVTPHRASQRALEIHTWIHSKEKPEIGPAKKIDDYMIVEELGNKLSNDFSPEKILHTSPTTGLTLEDAFLLIKRLESHRAHSSPV